MEITQHEAHEILQQHNITIDIEDVRTAEQIAMQLIELGRIALDQNNAQSTQQ